MDCALTCSFVKKKFIEMESGHKKGYGHNTIDLSLKLSLLFVDWWENAPVNLLAGLNMFKALPKSMTQNEIWSTMCVLHTLRKESQCTYHYHKEKANLQYLYTLYLTIDTTFSF